MRHPSNDLLRPLLRARLQFTEGGMSMTFTDRLEERERTGLADIATAFQSGAREPFDAIEGRVLSEQRAPDPLNYPDTDAGRREYLRDCWEWAVDDLANTIRDRPEGLTLPEGLGPGDFDGFSRDTTDDLDAAIIAHAEWIDDVIEARKQVETVEEAIKDA